MYHCTSVWPTTEPYEQSGQQSNSKPYEQSGQQSNEAEYANEAELCKRGGIMQMRRNYANKQKLCK